MSTKNKNLYLPHIEEHKLPAPAKMPILEYEEPQNSPDLFLWCVDDITLKLKEQKAELPDDFRETLYRSIFAETLNMAFEELSSDYQKEVSALSSLETVEEVLTALSDLMEAEPVTGFIFNKALIAAYVSKCMHYGLSANKLVSSLLYQQ